MQALGLETCWPSGQPRGDCRAVYRSRRSGSFREV